MVKQFEVYLLNLDELPSTDAKNTRPAVVISPDEMNRNVETAIVAPYHRRLQNIRPVCR
jgi:mRNA interferase MazF